MASVVEVIDLTEVIDVRNIGMFIGKKGCNLKSIERKAKVLIEVRTETGGDAKILLTGQPNAIAAARLEIDELAVNILRRSLCHFVMIPSHLSGLIIGKKGNRINAIENMTGVKIRVGDIEDNSFTSLRIYGTFRDIVFATSLIKEHVDNSEASKSFYGLPNRKEFYEQLKDTVDYC